VVKRWPFSCAAWIASIHRGIDVARADGLTHVAGCTGATSEATVQALHDLPDHAMLDMGDFAGGMLKYLRRHPVARVTIGGGIGKMSKLALEAYSMAGSVLADRVAHVARAQVKKILDSSHPIAIDTVVIDRVGKIIARAGP